MEIRIVLVDDHVLFREGLRSLLAQEQDLKVVGEASSGSEAIKIVRASKPHVVVMDVAMPGLNGTEATRQIVSENPDTNVLCLSMHGGEEFVSPVLERGARGYLTKECAATELVSAIRCVSLGQTYLSPAVAGAAVSGLLSSGFESSHKQMCLTPRESEVLQLIAEGYETKQIAERLHLSVKTVATHRTNLMDKIGVHGTADLTKYAIRHGIASLDGPSAG